MSGTDPNQFVAKRTTASPEAGYPDLVHSRISAIEVRHGTSPTLHLIGELAALAETLPETADGEYEALARCLVQTALNRAAHRVARAEHARRLQRSAALSAQVEILRSTTNPNTNITVTTKSSPTGSIPEPVFVHSDIGACA